MSSRCGAPGHASPEKLLDRRHRDRACTAATVPLRVNELIGTDADALTYVLPANQHRRELTKSQRAAVAATPVPMVSEQVAEEGGEKVRQTWQTKREGGLQPEPPPSRTHATV